MKKYGTVDGKKSKQVIHSFIQSSRQSVSPSVSQSVSHSFIHSFIQSVSHSFIHSISQSVSQSISQSVSHPSIHPSIHPSSQSVSHSVSQSVIHSFILSFKHSLVLLITHIYATLKIWMKQAWVRFRKDFSDSDDVQGKNWSITIMIPETIIEGHILATVPFSFLKRILYSFIHSQACKCYYSFHNRRFMSQERQTRHFAQSTRWAEKKQIERLLPVYCSGSSAHLHPQLTDGSDVKRTKQANVIRAPHATMQKHCTAKNQFSLNRNNLPKDFKNK